MIVKPISLDGLCQKLDVAFKMQDGNIGSHSVIDTRWSKFLEEFSDLVNSNQLLRDVYFRGGNLDVLDVGCGSSLTLFEAIESIENQVDRSRVNGYGLTASSQFLKKGSTKMMRDAILRNYTEKTPEYQRVALLLDGVQENEEFGLHRYSPKGNLMRFKEGDVHDLQRTLPDQKFDLIYSSAAYPHLLCPWLAFEKSVDALKEGGILLIDSMPTTEIVDLYGNVVSPEDYSKMMEEANPSYKLHFKSSSNPFYAPIVVEKKTDEDVNTLLSFGTFGEKTMKEKVVGIVNK